MPKIQPQDKRPDVEHKHKLHPDLSQEFKDYCRYLGGSDESYIVSELLTAQFKGDTDFKKWRDGHPAGATEPPAGSRKRGRAKAVTA